MAVELEFHLVELEQGGYYPNLFTIVLSLLLSIYCVAIEAHDIFASWPPLL